MDTFGASYFIDVYLLLYGPKVWPKGGSGGGRHEPILLLKIKPKLLKKLKKLSFS